MFSIPLAHPLFGMILGLSVNRLKYLNQTNQTHQAEIQVDKKSMI